MIKGVILLGKLGAGDHCYINGGSSSWEDGRPLIYQWWQQQQGGRAAIDISMAAAAAGRARDH